MANTIVAGTAVLSAMLTEMHLETSHQEVVQRMKPMHRLMNTEWLLGKHGTKYRSLPQVVPSVIPKTGVGTTKERKVNRYGF